MENQTTTQEQITKTISNPENPHQLIQDVIQQVQENTNIPDRANDFPSPPFPENPTTGKTYQGVNILVLWGAAIKNHYPTHEWATFKQWQQQNEVVRKGEKGTMIVYYDTMEKQVNGETQQIRFLKSSYVFNRSQLKSCVPD